MSKIPTPKRGEIWLVNFDPAIGAEIRKLRPAVVVTGEGIGRLPLQIVVPVTDWKPHYGNVSWFIHLPASAASGLNKDSGVDAFQVKSLSEEHFSMRLGQVTGQQIEDIAAAIALCVGAA